MTGTLTDIGEYFLPWLMYVKCVISQLYPLNKRKGLKVNKDLEHVSL